MKKLLVFFFIINSQLSYTQTFDLDTLLWSGPSDNRINLVILGDGYRTMELDQFISDARSISDELFQETPYKEYKDFFNVVAIKVPSNESGASHPGTASDVTEPAHPVSIVDNYFGSTFDAFDIHRLLVAENTFAIANVLSSNFPIYDQVLMLVNSPYYGGSGGEIPLASLDVQASEIAIHELGHSFAQLSDEYYAGDIFSVESKNMTRESNSDLVRWKNWVGDNNIGVFQHCCGGNSSSWYKPHQNCKMQILGTDFCSVCKEGTIETIYSFVSILDNYSPENTGIIAASDELKFEISPVKPAPNTLDIEWSLNGESISTNSNSVTVASNDFISGDNRIQVTVTDTTTLLRSANKEILYSETILWEVNNNTASIDEITSSRIKLSLFPSPIHEQLNFSIDSDTNTDYTVRLTDMSGQQVFLKNFHSDQLDESIHLAHLPQGAYTFTILFMKGIEASQMIIKN